MKSKPVRIKLDTTNIVSLFVYEKEVRNNILRYKESKDILLAKIFIHPYWVWRFRKYTIIPVPSTIQANNKRGFRHMEEIVRRSGFKNIEACLKHCGEKEQALQHFSKRQNVSNYLMLENESVIRGKRLLLIDDILTSGETMKACVNLLKPYAKDIRCLVISSGKKWYKKTSS
ncbi:ComF family protein [Erysipelothrix urinaevulpis]|uniref:ComF family protein n=1 Tax=Erysipelothrix urinaevulpis TaxID=2683717 RepID=UPI00135C6F84|nr:phosphoribosyltransferase family protein [Erysipelothrix urinaevulpis]